MSTVHENGFDPTSASCIALEEFENPETIEEAPEMWSITDPHMTSPE
jgi:hypothetical protein